MKTAIIRKLLSLLPSRIGLSLYYRIFCGHPQYFQHLFTAAPLREFPHTTMDLKSTDVAHGQIAFLGYYELHLSRTLINLARTTGGTLLDVGANYGYFSLLWCAANPRNRVIAVEASPTNIAALHINIARNRLEDRIEVLELAATDHDGTLTFDVGPKEQTGWGGIAISPTSGCITVQARRLDHVLIDQAFTAVKIDCEGADPLVVEGLSGLLQRQRIAHVFFERHPFRMAALGVDDSSAISLLEQSGYIVERVGPPAVSEKDVLEFHARLPQIKQPSV